MKIVLVFFGLGVLAMLYARPAQALTITNSDPDPHTITVTVGADSQELTIEPDKAVEPPCDKGCVVELESGEQYEMQGGEDASIEDGVIFVDQVPGVGDEDEDESAAEVPEEPSEEGSSPDQTSAIPPSGPEGQ